MIFISSNHFESHFQPSSFTRPNFIHLILDLPKGTYYLCYATTSLVTFKNHEDLQVMSKVTGLRFHFHATLAPTHSTGHAGTVGQVVMFLSYSLGTALQNLDYGEK